MTTSNTHVPTANGEKYVRQLCKHWSHKLDVELDGGNGTVRFPDGEVHMQSLPDGIDVSISSKAEDTVERLKGVLERHLDRFAFREGPLAYDWSAA